MQWIARWTLVIALFVSAPVPAAAGEADDPWRVQSHTDVEAHARDLDHRVIALQHELFAARYNGDQATIERAETDLKQVQAERVTVLRQLGQLR